MSIFDNILRAILGTAKKEAQAILDQYKPTVCAAIDKGVNSLADRVGSSATGDAVRGAIRAEVNKELAKVKMPDDVRALVSAAISGYIDGIDLIKPQVYSVGAIRTAAEQLKTKINGARL